MSGTIDEFLKSVTFEVDWTPSAEDMMEIFMAASRNYIAESSSHGYRDQEKVFLNLLLKNDQIFYWVWNKFPDSRKSTISSLITLHRNNGTYYGPKLTPGNVASIMQIVSASYDSIDKDADDIECQRFRVELARLLKKNIDFKAAYFEANLLKNDSLANFWKNSGLENSNDPEFYSLIWSHITRGSGYTNERNNVIVASSKATSVPPRIVEDLIAGGHSKNKLQLIRVVIGRMDGITNKYRYTNAQYSQEDSENIDYHKSILARFASSEDYDVQRVILPYLSKQDFVFAAPIASKLGLGSLVERIMKQNSWINR